MAKNHGAKDQKRAAKQKAKRQAKRSTLHNRTSNDPTIRLQRVENWPVVQALVGEKIWEEGIGHLLIARRDSEGALVYAAFLVDVYCLGVKSAFWRAGTSAEIEEVVRKIEAFEKMNDATPACLKKIVLGAVEFARTLGFSPDPDYRHAVKLLDGIEPSDCSSEFIFGRNGRPFYVQGPNESPAEAAAIMRVVQDAGGHYITALSGDDLDESNEFGRVIDELESFGEDSDVDESP
jgi:hypothetical protein